MARKRDKNISFRVTGKEKEQILKALNGKDLRTFVFENLLNKK